MGLVMELNKWEQRLLDEWIAHDKLIGACDVDDTILPFKTATQEECDEVINRLKRYRDHLYLFMFTCRNEDGIKEAAEYARSKGLEFDSINKNPIPLPYGNVSKPYANFYLDDRGGLHQVLDMLDNVYYRYLSHKNKERMDYPGASGF